MIVQQPDTLCCASRYIAVFGIFLAKLTAGMASANDEETSLHHEERRLNLDVQRLMLEERRLLLEQKRLSLQEAAANTTQQAPAARPAHIYIYIYIDTKLNNVVMPFIY